MPYMGFFYKMYKSDIFVLDDDVQFTSPEYQNRNYIRVGGRRQCLTVPVSSKFGDKINEVKIADVKNWRRKMLRTIELAYRGLPYFDEVYKLVYEHITGFDNLAEMNISFIKKVAEGFGFKTKVIIASKDVPTELTSNQRNVYQCKKVGAGIYLSGVGGKAYNDDRLYANEGIDLIYSDFEAKPYKQKKTGFIANCSVIDYLFNNGYEIPKEWKDGKKNV